MRHAMRTKCKACSLKLHRERKTRLDYLPSGLFHLPTVRAGPTDRTHHEPVEYNPLHASGIQLPAPVWVYPLHPISSPWYKRILSGHPCLYTFCRTCTRLIHRVAGVCLDPIFRFILLVWCTWSFMPSWCS